MDTTRKEKLVGIMVSLPMPQSYVNAAARAIEASGILEWVGWGPAILEA